MENEIHIALSPDDNYTEHAVVCAISVLENMRDEKLVFHILDGGLCEASKRSFLVLSEVYKNVDIIFEKIDVSIFNSYKQTENCSVQTLFAILLPEINFCKNLERIIYLDSDTLTKTSLRPLWDTPFDNNYVLSVEDVESKKYSKKFLKGKEKFFNTGLMVINCNMWRRDEISLRAIKMAIDNSGNPGGYSKVVLNILLAGFVKFLDLKWNLQYSPMDIYPEFENIKEFKNAVKNPAIIHYFGKYKPWKFGYGCFCPNQEDYLWFHKLTLYRKENYKKWQSKDKFSFLKGIIYFIFKHPFFFFESNFWKNIKIK